MQTERFKTPRGTVTRVTLRNRHLTFRAVSWGAAVQDLQLAGVPHPLVLGLADPADYAAAVAPYFGSIVGRVANRIAGASAEIAGRRHRFDANERGATLHGGRAGSADRNWRIADLRPDRVTFADDLPDGHMGFPGRLRVGVTYRLDGAALEIALAAETDAPTVCNFAPHIYFNLSGGPAIDDHVLTLAADRYQPTDAGGIPLGDPEPVAATRFDFRAGAVPRRIDHNLCLVAARRAPVAVGVLAAGGVTMRITTTEPGLQVYDAGPLAVAPGRGLEGRGYGSRGGLALEPQAWIDAPNRAWRAQVDLAPGERYESLTRFAFARDATEGQDE